MLTKLYIKNYALIDELTVDFHSGLNIITGETGAGKSIIIGALGMLLGDKSSAELVRQGEEKAVVEGFFQVHDTVLLSSVLDDDQPLFHELILRREIHASGRSRCFINDSPATIQQLTEVGDLLVDLHGQHDHQSLLRVDNHMTYLDAYGDHAESVESVKTSYKSFRHLQTELNDLIRTAAEKNERMDLLSFQIQEIESVTPRPGEEEALAAQERLLRNSEKFFQLAEELDHSLYQGRESVSERLAHAENALAQLAHVEPQAQEWSQNFETARIAVEETMNSLQHFVAGIDFNPQRMETLRTRLSELNRLKKKYGGSMEQVFQVWENAKTDLERISHHSSQINDLQGRVEKERERLEKNALALSMRRRETAEKLQDAARPVLHELGLKNGKLLIQLTHQAQENGPVKKEGQPVRVTPKGIDHVEFLVSLNPGEEPKPLVKVASGGEISRIMLALKTILAKSDQVPVLIFDEIDTGISGPMARVVGQKMKDLAKQHQIIAITHLPLIASMGQHHYKVEKVVENRHAITRLTLLSDESRVLEIAKLISGDTITESSRQSARELLRV